MRRLDSKDSFLNGNGLPLLCFFVFCLFTNTGFALTCYEAFIKLAAQRALYEEPHVFTAVGAKFPNAYPFEKEGLYYREIEPLFNVLSQTGKEKLKARFDVEKSGKAPPLLLQWLREYTQKWRKPGIAPKPLELASKSEGEILAYLLSLENPLEAISTRGTEALFEKSLLSFDWLERNPKTQEWIALTDDQGSYEIKARPGPSDRDTYLEYRNFIERHFGGEHIGHQHLIHGWSEDATFRANTSGQYIELIDASSWYLFWRSLSHYHPDNSSILEHPYIGVHNRSALNRLAKAYEANNPKSFNNKNRTVGARNFPGDPHIPGQSQEENVISLEIRSGINKNDLKRGPFLDQLEARIISGDYNGIRDFRSYDFDASAPLKELVSSHLSPEEFETLERFEKIFPMMKFSSHGKAYNHFRNKITAPLLPWIKRLNIPAKQDLIERAQKRYAKALFEIATAYEQDLKNATNPYLIGKARASALEKIKREAWRFANKVNLEEDFEHYLTPIPKQEDLPDLRFNGIGNGNRIDINKIDLGVENSFRFGVRPNSKAQADELLLQSAEALRTHFGGGTITKAPDGGHGHGLSVRYLFTDPQGREWRVEWDGIQRSYNERNEPFRMRGGHIEIPSPKESPQDTRNIEIFYQAMRSIGQHPARSGGGAHVNFDLAPLRELGPKNGARMLANLISVFQSNRKMICFLWQHPYRQRVAMPPEVTTPFYEALDGFDGDFKDLGKLLYKHKYFNPFESRKPNYGELNLTPLMKDIVPEIYRNSIDIKKPNVEWFPSFDKKGDKGEFRLMDAMPNEYLAALQIKYIRALLNAAFNGEWTIKYKEKYGPNAKRDWLASEDTFMADAKSHLENWGLDFREFLPLVLEARRIQYAKPSNKELLEEGEFLPGTDPDTGEPVTFLEPEIPEWTNWEF